MHVESGGGVLWTLTNDCHVPQPVLKFVLTSFGPWNVILNANGMFRKYFVEREPTVPAFPADSVSLRHIVVLPLVCEVTFARAMALTCRSKFYFVYKPSVALYEWVYTDTLCSRTCIKDICTTTQSGSYVNGSRF